jgi:hypothetical protein
LISRNADLRLQTDAFERGRTSVNQIAAAHHGFLEHLATEGHTGRGRVLSATVSVPATEFDVAMADLKKLGRVEALAEGGEDSAVKLENAARNVEATKLDVRLSDRGKQIVPLPDGLANGRIRLRNFLFDFQRIVQLPVAVALQILKAFQRDLPLLEDFRAPLEARFGGAWLGIRNSITKGVSSTLTTMFGMAFEYGLPIAFWGFILFWPGKAAWLHLRASTAAL